MSLTCVERRVRHERVPLLLHPVARGRELDDGVQRHGQVGDLLNLVGVSAGKE
jgi:hypothetical protein